jgi:hypothetical protein
MQIKHYDILDSADITVIQAWADDPNNRCCIIAKGSVGSVTHSLCVNQPPGMHNITARTEAQLAGMITESAWPE